MISFPRSPQVAAGDRITSSQLAQLADALNARLGKLPDGTLPATEWNSDRIFSLPLFPDMTVEDVGDVVNTIKEVLK